MPEISNLTSAGTLTGAEVVPVVQSGTTKKGLISAVLAYIVAALPTSTAVWAGTASRSLTAALGDVVTATAYGAVGNGSTDDRAAIQAAWDTGRSVILPRTASGYRIGTPGLVLGSNNRGQMLIGEGDYQSILRPDNNVDCITLTGSNWRGKLRDFGIEAAGGTGRGIYASGSVAVWDTVFENLYVDAGGNAIEILAHFSHQFRGCRVSSHNGHGFCLTGGNTVELFQCYAQSIRAARKAGYRIANAANLIGCNGVNLGDYWGIFGANAPHTGTAQSGSTSSTIKLSTGAVAWDFQYEAHYITITAGTGVGQRRFCTTYVGSTRVATITPNWTITPDATSQYSVDDGDFGVTLYAEINMHRCNVEDFVYEGIRMVGGHRCFDSNRCTYQAKENTAIECFIHYAGGDVAAQFNSVLTGNVFFMKSGSSRTYGADVVTDFHPPEVLTVNQLVNSVWTREFGALRYSASFDTRTIRLPIAPTADPADGTGRVWVDSAAGRVLKLGT
jgi:hypothetical protein